MRQDVVPSRARSRRGPTAPGRAMTGERIATAEGLNQSYSLLVSSCDAYADCWGPFFSLLAKYWQPPPAIYLNTETQAFSFPGLEIRCPCVGASSWRRLPWSELLLRTLDQIPQGIVLYMQEDYFIHDTVDAKTIGWFVELMEGEGISHISFERRNLPPGEKSPYRFLSR